MSNLLEKNLEALKFKNSELVEKLRNYIPNDIPQLIKENGFYNFLYKNTKLHNPANPLSEAQEIFRMAENNPAAIHMIFGLGLGYLFQVASASSQGTVVLYEQDLNIIRAAFSLVDFSDDIKKPNVYIAETLSKAEKYIYEHSNTKNTPLLLSTNAYRELYNDSFNDMVASLQQTIGRFGMDLKYTQEKFYPILLQILDNLPSIVKEIPILELKDYYKGKTAVVVSAGPTLDRNIETIKKYRDNIILIVVGTAMKTINNHGLKPDFLCIIEANDCSKQILDIDMEGVNFVTEPFSHPNLRNKNYAKTFLHASSNMPINNFWAKISGINIDEYLSKGTVSYTALNVARILGCSKIVLVGQDLAYIEGQCYSKDSAYKDLECKFNKENNRWEITAKDFDNFVQSLGNHPDYNALVNIAKERLENLNKSLYYVKGIKGDMIPTEAVYSAFIQPFTEFTEMFKGIDYINTSLVGAQIDGFKNISLEEALKDSEKIENREINCDFKYDILSIKESLFREKKDFQQAAFLIDDIQKMTKNLKNTLARTSTISADILKLFKKIMIGYNAITVDLSSKNMLLDFVTTAEKIDLDYEFKMTREFSIPVLKKLADKLYNFCENTNEKIKHVSEIIDTKIGEIQ